MCGEVSEWPGDKIYPERKIQKMTDGSKLIQETIPAEKHISDLELDGKSKKRDSG
jgi:hypothetical protein